MDSHVVASVGEEIAMEFPESDLRTMAAKKGRVEYYVHNFLHPLKAISSSLKRSWPNMPYNMLDHLSKRDFENRAYRGLRLEWIKNHSRSAGDEW